MEDISDSLLEKTFEEVKEDLIQHYVRNNDYETGYLFEEVLKVYSLGYSSIKLFIESVLILKILMILIVFRFLVVH
jgi:hypothetical protein